MSKILLTTMMILLIAPAVLAQDDGFGLGLMVGEPTGISWKLWMGSNTALDGGLAWSLDDDAEMHIHADYIIHHFDAIKSDEVRIPAYYGIGGRVKLGDDHHDDWIGVRIPLGLNYQLKSAPLDFFVEIVPIMDLAPETDFDLNAAIGVRYFFGGGGSTTDSD